jgi:hypothetical protein
MKRPTVAAGSSSPSASSSGQAAGAAAPPKKRPRVPPEDSELVIGFGDDEASDEEDVQDTQPDPTGVEDGVPPEFDAEEDEDFGSLEAAAPESPAPSKLSLTASAPNPKVLGVATEIPQRDVVVLRGGPAEGCAFLLRNIVGGEEFVFGEDEVVSLHNETASGKHRAYVARKAAGDPVPRVSWVTPKPGSKAEHPALLEWTAWEAEGGERFLHRRFTDGWHELKVYSSNCNRGTQLRIWGGEGG